MAGAACLTDGAHGKARVESSDVAALRKALDQGQIPGFLRLSGDLAGWPHHHARPRRLRYVGGGACRGARVRIAATSLPMSKAFTPAIRGSCRRRRKIERITYEEMLEMASLGARVLETRSVALAMRHAVRLQVLSSFTRTTTGYSSHRRGRKFWNSKWSAASPTAATKPRSR